MGQTKPIANVGVHTLRMIAKFASSVCVLERLPECAVQSARALEPQQPPEGLSRRTALSAPDARGCGVATLGARSLEGSQLEGSSQPETLRSDIRWACKAATAVACQSRRDLAHKAAAATSNTLQVTFSSFEHEGSNATLSPGRQLSSLAKRSFTRSPTCAKPRRNALSPHRWRCAREGLCAPAQYRWKWHRRPEARCSF